MEVSSNDEKMDHHHQKVEEKKKLVPEELVEKIAIYFVGKKGGKLNEGLLEFKAKGVVQFCDEILEIRKMDKIRVFTEFVREKHPAIKFSQNEESETTIGVNLFEKKFDMPLHYYIFARLVQEKLILSNIKLEENLDEKIPGLSEVMVGKAHKYGKLLKKSQYLGKWEERLIIIDEKGLFSYKKPTEKPSMSIGRHTVSEILTKFEQ